MKQGPGFKHSQSRVWQNHRVAHFWRPVKKNTVVLQLSIEGLPNAVVTVVESHCLVMSHCHGFYPNSQFCAQLQRYSGMDAVGGETALTTASDASREPMMLMQSSRVHSGATAESRNYWPHLLGQGTDLSALERYHIKNHQYAHSWGQEDEPAPSLWAVVWKYVREVLNMGKPFKYDRTGQQTLWAQFRKSLSERRHRDRAGRMESGCVRVSILSATIEGLLRLLASSHVTLCSFRLLHWLICRIIT